MAAREMFGAFLDKFKFKDEKIEDQKHSNQIATDFNDGAVTVGDDPISQYAINLDWTYNTQAELINKYREIANYNMVDYAVEDIINEMVSFDENEDPVKLDLSEIDDNKLSENIKDKVYDAWEKVSRILDLKSTIHRRAKSFYVDGRLAYQKVIDKNKPKDGLLDAIELDTRHITKYRSIDYDENDRVIKSIKEYFVYDDSSADQESDKRSETAKKYKEALILDPKTVCYVTSGMTDSVTGYSVSWLHKAVKPANQLRMMENALVIYRISRAPERRVFYVDTANLPKAKAEQYIQNLKSNYRNRMSFDPETGTFKDQRHLQTMQEDYWLPRNSSGRGTEVDTLPGGQNLDQIEDIIYFQKQLYKALNIPITRLETDNLVSLGRSQEISRDELKFSKFVSKIRKRFNMMFLDLLKTELILTKVITAKEWDVVKHKIQFDYALDMYLEEMKKSEMLRDRLDLIREAESHIGRYFSNDFVRRKILKQSDEDIKEEDKKIKDEKSVEQYNPADDGMGGLR
jgi:hypothetical protein